jgi:hypothetical protein
MSGFFEGLSTHLPLLYANEEMKEPNENQEVKYVSW